MLEPTFASMKGVWYRVTCFVELILVQSFGTCESALAFTSIKYETPDTWICWKYVASMRIQSIQIQTPLYLGVLECLQFQYAPNLAPVCIELGWVPHGMWVASKKPLVHAPSIAAMFCLAVTILGKSDSSAKISSLIFSFAALRLIARKNRPASTAWSLIPWDMSAYAYH